MSSKMLIDAAHPEETRVAVVRGNRLEDFDYESATRKQLKGNIYLAKVTRVEPSLQAAFVDYGGNRHGFLAFNEIHPDYYQIPVADRQALLEEEAEEESRAMAEEAAYDDESPRSRKRRSRKKSNGKSADVQPDEASGAAALEASSHTESISEDSGHADDDARPENAENGAGNGSSVESVGLEDALEELPVRARKRRNYKIQEVIKRRQIILIQVVKEERGNKGAALTTYISLAGRYTVLMPNTARGGGISRKITNPTDRKRLRKIAGDLEVPGGMGLIIRTAGASRTKAEIKRDFEYLLRMWENIRDLTLSSTAPTLVYEEGNLIKRSIRDLYGKEIDSVMVSGDEAYKEAKGFMKLLMPSHAKNVQPYKEPEPIFVRHQIERQLGAMFSPHVTLKSGGYIVINQTEALVSVDVNSGRATREHSIEDTALRTNLEAADELTRQLRLRDLAGLIVIDFIDMEERRNNRAVERRLKEALKNDRARIQVGRISPFGLLEMSRQRLRAGMLEGTTTPCAVCQGTGIVRSTESVALDVLRSIEDTLMSEGKTNLVATTSYDAALYILNHKRTSVYDIEARYGVSVVIAADNDYHGANFTIERGSAGDAELRTDRSAIHMDDSYHSESAEEGEEEDGGHKRSRRRRRRRGGRDRAETDGVNASDAAYDADDDDSDTDAHEASDSEEGARRPRRRGKRGGRRARGRNRSADTQAAGDSSSPAGEPGAQPEARSEAADAAVAEEASADSADKGNDKAAGGAETVVVEAVVSEAAIAVDTVSDEAVAEDAPKRKTPRAKAKSGEKKTARDKDKTDKPAKTARRSRKKASDEAVGEGGDKAGGAPEEPEPAPAEAGGGNGAGLWNESPELAPVKPAQSSQDPDTPAAARRTSGDDRSDDSEPRRGWWQRRA